MSILYIIIIDQYVLYNAINYEFICLNNPLEMPPMFLVNELLFQVDHLSGTCSLYLKHETISSSLLEDDRSITALILNKFHS